MRLLHDQEKWEREMNINYHVHTPLCHHAAGTMETYVKTAIAMGLSEICFLDHLTLNKPDDSNSMSLDDVPHYFAEGKALGKQYQNVISVKIGLEVDYDPSASPVINELISQFSFDVIGGSVHFLGDCNIVSHRSVWCHGEGDPDEIYSQYYDALLAMLDEDYVDVICHFDLVKKFSRKSRQTFADKIHSVLLKIKATHRVVEVNTSGYDHPVAEAYPSASILRQCRKLDIPITLGSDAHRPEELKRGYNRAQKLIADAGYDELTVFTNRKPQRRPLI